MAPVGARPRRSADADAAAELLHRRKEPGSSIPDECAGKVERGRGRGRAATRSTDAAARWVAVAQWARRVVMGSADFCIFLFFSNLLIEAAKKPPLLMLYLQ